jgi:hypothetical protein
VYVGGVKREKRESEGVETKELLQFTRRERKGERQRALNEGGRRLGGEKEIELEFPRD